MWCGMQQCPFDCLGTAQPFSFDFMHESSTVWLWAICCALLPHSMSPCICTQKLEAVGLLFCLTGETYCLVCITSLHWSLWLISTQHPGSCHPGKSGFIIGELLFSYKCEKLKLAQGSNDACIHCKGVGQVRSCCKLWS